MKKIKEYLRRIAAVVVICATFVAGWAILGYMVVDDSKNFTRLTMHEFYEQDHIDAVFIGASHCSVGINPMVLDDKLQMNTYNLGSAGQPIDLTYLLLKEAIQSKDVKHVYVDLSYSMAEKTERKRENPDKLYIITDYMKPSLRKYEYLFCQFETDLWANNVFYARRKWEDLFDSEYVAKTLVKKQKDSYKNYDSVNNGEREYIGKGYVTIPKAIPDGTYFTSKGYRIIDTENMSQEWIDTVLAMVDYCDKHNVELTFISVPEPTIINVNNRDLFNEFVAQVLDGTGVEFYDFNLMRKEYWEDTSTYFLDDNHMNEAGSTLFSELFGDFINGDISEEELFYSSMKEKLADLEPTVYGIVFATTQRDGVKTYGLRIVSNREEMEYKVTAKLDSGETYVMQDFDKNNEFEIYRTETGVYTIEYRTLDNLDEVKTTDIVIGETE